MAAGTFRKKKRQQSGYFFMFTLTWITEKELEGVIEDKGDEFRRRLVSCLYSVIVILTLPPAVGLDEIKMLNYCTERQNAQIVCPWRPVHLCEKDLKMRQETSPKKENVEMPKS